MLVGKGRDSTPSFIYNVAKNVGSFCLGPLSNCIADNMGTLLRFITSSTLEAFTRHGLSLISNKEPK